MVRTLAYVGGMAWAGVMAALYGGVHPLLGAVAGGLAGLWASRAGARG